MNEHDIIERKGGEIVSFLINGIRYNVFGEMLTMRDGSMWFHPYSGEKPKQIRKAAP